MRHAFHSERTKNKKIPTFPLVAGRSRGRATDQSQTRTQDFIKFQILFAWTTFPVFFFLGGGECCDWLKVTWSGRSQSGRRRFQKMCRNIRILCVCRCACRDLVVKWRAACLMARTCGAPSGIAASGYDSAVQQFPAAISGRGSTKWMSLALKMLPWPWRVSMASAAPLLRKWTDTSACVGPAASIKGKQVKIRPQKIVKFSFNFF